MSRVQLIHIVLLCAVSGWREVLGGRRNGLTEVWNDIALQTAQTPKCQSCSHLRRYLESTLIEAELRNIRIEAVKQTILSGLGLTQPPHVTGPPVTLPRLITQGSLHSEQLDREPELNQPRHSTEKNILLFSDIKYLEVSGRYKMNLVLEIPTSVQDQDMSSVSMWIHTGESNLCSCTLRFRSCKESALNNDSFWKNIIIRQNSTKDGWSQLDITLEFAGWMEFGELCQNITLQCENEIKIRPPDTKDSSFSPFILVNVISNHIHQSSREKRNINCVKGSTECCRESLHISFNDIGWGDWIIQPTHYNAYYCKGSCTNAATISLSTAPYYSVLRKVYYPSPSQGQHMEVVPCCTPARLSPLQIIYRNKNNTLVEKVIQDLTVHSCGCA